MKTISTTLQAHLNSEVTSICTCWKIVRTDGMVFGFTDHDVDIVVDGLNYESETGYTRTAITNSSNMSVDNLDIEGVLVSDKISEEDLRNGLFDFAQVYIFAVNWQDPTQGIIKLRRGWFGEVTQGQNQMFMSEMRGLTQALSYNTIELFSPECRTDFCSPLCKLNLANFQHDAVVQSVTSRSLFTTSALPDIAGVTSVGAHRHWRILINNVFDPDFGGFAEFQAWNQNGDLLTGGDPEASSSGHGHPPENARDGQSSSSWRTHTANNADANPIVIDGSWWRIDFPVAVDIKTFALQAPIEFTETPTAFRLEYTDDDPTRFDANWLLAKQCTASWSAAGEVAVWGLGSATSDPINYPASQVLIPPPYTGASSYIGGTVTFTSGDNTGRTIEIIGYNDATGQVTLFEAASYPVSVGDTFKIAQGCVKTRDACRTYNNVVNFRGEPDVPGQDEYLQYPDAS